MTEDKKKTENTEAEKQAEVLQARKYVVEGVEKMNNLLSEHVLTLPEDFRFQVMGRIVISVFHGFFRFAVLAGEEKLEKNKKMTLPLPLPGRKAPAKTRQTVRERASLLSRLLWAWMAETTHPKKAELEEFLEVSLGTMKNDVLEIVNDEKRKEELTGSCTGGFVAARIAKRVDESF